MDKHQQRLLESLPDGIVVADQKGRIEFVSRQALKMSGYSRKELIGRNVEMLVPTSTRAIHRVHRAGYAAKPTTRAMGSGLRISFRRKDGTEFPADIALSKFETSGGPGVIAAVRDVSERTRTELALRDAEEGIRLMVDGVVDYAIFQLDAGGNVTSWNGGAERIKGYRAKEIIGRHFSIFYLADDIKHRKPQKGLTTARRIGRFEEEGWRLRKDGSRFWANVVITRLRDAKGAVRGFTKVTRDISERKRTEDRVEAMFEVTQATLQGQAPDQIMSLVVQRARGLVEAAQGLALVPDADGTNVTVTQADGLRSKVLIGTTYPAAKSLAGWVLRTKELIAVEDAGTDPRAHRPFARAALAGPAILAPLVADNSSFGVLALSNPKSKTPFSAEDLATVRVFAAQAAVALEHSRLRLELQRLAVLEDRERIARELHDGAIQSLFAVGMSLQGLVARTAAGEPQARIESAVTQIDRVIRDLRNYIFGLRPGILQDVQLHQALTRVAQDFQKRTSVSTVIDIDPHVAAHLSSHAGDLIQLTTEALSNVARHAAARTCRVSLQSNRSGALLEIDDDGKGFDPAQALGAGQGLRNLRERTDKLGGRLEIKSAAHQGTSVRVTIRL